MLCDFCDIRCLKLYFLYKGLLLFLWAGSGCVEEIGPTDNCATNNKKLKCHSQGNTDDSKSEVQVISYLIIYHIFMYGVWIYILAQVATLAARPRHNFEGFTQCNLNRIICRLKLWNVKPYTLTQSLRLQYYSTTAY